MPRLPRGSRQPALVRFPRTSVRTWPRRTQTGDGKTLIPVLVNWEKYLAPWIRHLSPLSAPHTMHVVGVLEILAGAAVAIKPRYGAYVVAAWLGGIVINLLSYSGYHDIALRDFGLMLAALALARLASKYDPPGIALSGRR